MSKQDAAFNQEVGDMLNQALEAASLPVAKRKRKAKSKTQIVEGKQYQLFDELRPEELSALEADILARGMMVPIEVDENGNILDGHHRAAICKKHGLKCKRVVRKFGSEREKIEHVFKMNLIRRHLDPLAWGVAFKKLLKLKGVRRERGANQGKHLATVAECASEVGVSDRTARQRVKLADEYDALSKSEQKEVDDGDKTLQQATREVATSKKKAAPLPTDKYTVIYADPPWNYGNTYVGMGGGYGPAEGHYPTMKLTELCDMKIAGMAAKDAVLFLWATSPMLEDAFAIIRAWGFKYKTSFVWDKVRHNFGHYNSVRHELLLVATRGQCKPQTTKLPNSVQRIERSGKHSEKPKEFRTIIEKLYPKGRRVELFARSKHKGWTDWGNDSSGCSPNGSQGYRHRSTQGLSR